MATTIYFPSINAEATISVDLKRGATAQVCAAYDGSAYFGKISRVKFTTVKPRDWSLREIDVLHHIPAGGFCYEIAKL